MSGGHFEYDNHKIRGISEELKRIINVKKHSKPEKDIDEFSDDDFIADIPDDIIQDFDDISFLLDLVDETLYAIDYYLSGDYGDDSYRAKVNEIKEKFKRLKNAKI